VTVADTGCGMEPELLRHAFEPFSQADRSLDRSRGGLGLGLALVKGLTELHGGRVEAASAGPGLGSTFTIRLPLTAAPADAPRPTAVAEGPRPAGGFRVLVVEDNRDAAESLKLLLTLWGHEVECTATGPAGLAAFDSRRPEVVVCDIGLPGGMDGYGVARAIRAAAGAQPYLIALTGYGQEEDQRRAYDAGFDVHLTKPVDPEQLEGLIAAQAGARRESAASVPAGEVA
jgi:CheY-like chemotaxis protein